ncbi:MAG: hypothetical protein A4S09_03590 [Proteobacteria bacterium SG_bin7]|nr:MAG: hypothetical protein A4S09_03590 [Proteobacteria bacterium SG_bin7]
MMILGVIVIIGWLVDSKILLRIHPDFEPMRFNLAICFVLGGISVFMLQLKNKLYSLLPTFLLGILSYLTFAQYLFGTSYKIDFLFFNSIHMAGLNPPGRMSPLAALCFSLGATVLTLLALPFKNQTTNRIIQYSGIFIFCIGSLAIFAHFTGSNLVESWSQYSRMAIHASFGLGLFGYVLYVQTESLSVDKFLEIYSLILFLLIGQFYITSSTIWLFIFLGMVMLATHLQLKNSQKHLRIAKEEAHEQAKASREIADALETFFNLSVDLLCIAGTDGMFKRLSASFTRVLGYSEEELLARPFVDFVHPNDVSSTLAAVEKLAAGYSVINFENRYRCKNGSYRNFNWSAFPDLTTGSLYSVARDVTEANIAARSRLEILRGLDASAIVSITDDKGIISYVNDKFCEINGYTKEELIGRSHRILNSGFHPADYFKEMWSTIKSGKIWHGEVCNRRKSGDLYWVDSAITPILGEDGRRQYLAIRFDITERKLAMTQLQTSSRLVALGEMVAGVGHEINNPLAIAQGYVERIERILGTTGTTDPRLMNSIAKIHVAHDRIMNIVKGMRTFARADTDQKYMVSIPKALEEMKNLLLELYKREGVELKVVESDLQDNLMVLGSTGKIQQILMNIIQNAKDATEGSEKRQIICSLAESTSKVCILTVSDNGVGVPESIRDKVFQPFFTTKSVGKGTGLGLAIASNLAKELNGTISLESTVGVGTKVTITIPVLEQKLKCDVEAAVVNLPKSIFLPNGALVVDDEPELREIIAHHLQSLGVSKVTLAKDGKEALLEIKKNKFDLVLTDLHMPEKDGVSLLKDISKMDLAPQPTCILMTGGIFNHLGKYGDDAPSLFDGLISKPFRADRFLSVLQEAVVKRGNGQVQILDIKSEIAN